MLSTLRIAAVIGVIYYLSPVRNEDAKAGVDHMVSWGKGLIQPSRESNREMNSAERLEALWKALPEDTKQAAIDRVLAEAGRQIPLGTSEHARPHEPAAQKASEAKKAKP
jgi:hypothetical protein